MLFLDVNVALYAFRHQESERAARVREWLKPQLTGDETIGLSEQVLSSVVRISTSTQTYARPSSPDEAITFVDSLLAAPAARVVRPGPKHWDQFRNLVIRHRLRGKAVPDAYLAAIALEAGATMVSTDGGFRRFDRLRVLNPLES